MKKGLHPALQNVYYSTYINLEERILCIKES